MNPETLIELRKLANKGEVAPWLVFLLNAESERNTLTAAVGLVRALHYPADNDGRRTPRCESCHGKAGAHECGCWSEFDRQPVCGTCNEGRLGLAVPWPCPTIRAIDKSEPA